MIFNMIAICPEETKEILVSELKDIGAKEIDPQFKAVHFKVDERGFYEAHLRLRTASRLMKIVKVFSAKEERMLYDQARRIHWDEIFAVNQTFMIEGVPGERGEDVMSANTISKRIREALQAWFLHKENAKPTVDLEKPDVYLTAFVRNGKCILSVDTSGKSMHKRGYRSDRHPAPIKETLAAAILKMLDYKGDVPLYDPMCGSGTIAIEGASMALNKAALIHRKKDDFGFERLPFFNKTLWREIQEEARKEKSTELPAPVFAADINPKFIEAARDNALRARVERYIQFNTGDFFELPAPADHGLLVCNMPYGERIKGADADNEVAYFKAIGDKLKKDYTGWRAALLVAEDSPWKLIGLKPKRRIALFNGSIPVRLVIFDLYKGTKRIDHSKSE